MARFCQNCGNEMNANADLCLKCGMLVRKNNVAKEESVMPGWAVTLIILSISGVILLPIIIFFFSMMFYELY